MTKRTQSAARPARSSASARVSPTASTAPTRSEPRRSGPSTVPGDPGRPAPSTTPSSSPAPRSTPATSWSAPGSGTRKRTHAPPARSTRAQLLVGSTGSPSAAASASPFRSTSSVSRAQLRVVPAAEPGGQLDDVRAALADDDLRVRRPVANAERLRRRPRGVDRRADLVRCERARPDVRERNAERRRLGDEAVGDGQRREAAVDRERVHRHLAARERAPRRGRRSTATRASASANASASCDSSRHEHEPFLALAVGRLDDARVAEPGRCRRRLLEASSRRRGAGAGTPASANRSRWRQLRRREHGRRRVDAGAAARAARRSARRSRPASRSPARSMPSIRSAVAEPVDLRLVLDRDDRPPVGEAEARRGRIAVGGDHVEVPCARAASSSPSCPAPAPRTRRRFVRSAGFPATSRHSRDTTRRCAPGPPRTRCARATRASRSALSVEPMWRST